MEIRGTGFGAQPWHVLAGGWKKHGKFSKPRFLHIEDGQPLPTPPPLCRVKFGWVAAFPQLEMQKKRGWVPLPVPASIPVPADDCDHFTKSNCHLQDYTGLRHRGLAAEAGRTPARGAHRTGASTGGVGMLSCFFNGIKKCGCRNR